MSAKATTPWMQQIYIRVKAMCCAFDNGRNKQQEGKKKKKRKKKTIFFLVGLTSGWSKSQRWGQADPHRATRRRKSKKYDWDVYLASFAAG